MNKSIVIRITGPAGTVDGGLEAFARTHGWKEEMVDEKQEPMPALEFARRNLGNYIRSGITSWNHNMLRVDQGKRNSVEQDQVLEAISKELDQAVLTVTVEE